MNNIFMSGPNIGKLEEEYVLDALRNGWYENKYYYVEKFEQNFASWHGRKYSLMTPNCTTATWLLLGGLGIGEGDEVIVPECTWIASVVSSYHLGAKLVFCDINPHTWCLCTESVKQKITKKTKAILAVNLYGNMADWDELEKIAKENNIYLIEDAAESLGSTYRGRRSGSFGTGSVFSFHNTKTITTGEGGMLLLDDKELFNKCVKLRDLGRGPETKPYYNELIGFKFMPFNIQAALGLAQFERIDELVAQRRDIFNLYRENLKDLDVTFNYEDNESFNCAWLTTIVIGKDYNIDKNKFIARMGELGTPARPFFYPLSSLPPFNIDLSEENPISYDISRRGVNLPSASNLTKKGIDTICKNIKTILYEKRHND
jgi:perosamine synthetase